jgi:hypothetical protein
MSLSITKETEKEFNARIETEDEEAKTVKCPLDSCGAEVGEPCCTESGRRRCRHTRRLMEARKKA